VNSYVKETSFDDIHQVPSHFYSYSFALNSNWSQEYTLQPGIEAYFKDVANKYGIERHVRLNRSLSLPDGMSSQVFGKLPFVILKHRKSVHAAQKSSSLPLVRCLFPKSVTFLAHLIFRDVCSIRQSGIILMTGKTKTLLS
jgi:hypothetical protein